MVVGRGDFDDVDADDRQLIGDPAYGVQQLTRRQPARLWCARAGRMAGIADIDVDGEEHPVAVIGRDREGLGQALGQAAVHDLGHLIGTQALLGHPVQRLGLGPIAAEPHLQEPVAAQRTGFDQSAHRLPVPDQ